MGQKTLVSPLKKPTSAFFRFFAQNGPILMELGNLALINKTSPRAADTFGQKKFKYLEKLPSYKRLKAVF